MVDTFLELRSIPVQPCFHSDYVHINRAIRVLTQVRGSVFLANRECVSPPTVPILRSFEISIIDATLDGLRDALPVALPVIARIFQQWNKFHII